MYILTPTPRPFYHVNKSNPSSTWGDKFERHTQLCANEAPINCIIGDSHVERLSRFVSSSIAFQEKYLPRFINCGIGGDKLQHLIWRALHGGIPANPKHLVMWIGSNNISNDSSNQAKSISNSITDFVSRLLSSHKGIRIIVVGILPRKQLDLSPTVQFVSPPKQLFSSEGNFNETFFRDYIHLNEKGYFIILKKINSTLNLPTNTPSHTSHQPTLPHLPHNSPFNNDFGIGESELLGCGWDGIPPVQHPQTPQPRATQSTPQSPTSQTTYNPPSNSIHPIFAPPTWPFF